MWSESIKYAANWNFNKYNSSFTSAISQKIKHFDNKLVVAAILKKEMPNYFWFKLLKHVNLHLFHFFLWQQIKSVTFGAVNLKTKATKAVLFVHT